MHFLCCCLQLALDINVSPFLGLYCCLSTSTADNVTVRMQHVKVLALLTVFQFRGELFEFLVYCLFLWVGLALNGAVCNGSVVWSLSLPLLKHF